MIIIISTPANSILYIIQIDPLLFFYCTDYFIHK